MLRSLQLLSLGSAFLFVISVFAEEPPPLPKRSNPSNSEEQAKLKSLFSNSRETYSADETSVQTAHHEERTFEQLTPPNPIRQSGVRHASFATRSSPATSASSKNPFLDGQSHMPEYDDGYGFDEEEELAVNPILNRPLSSTKFSGEAGTDSEESEADGGGWTNRLPKPALTPLLSVGGSLLIVLAAFFLLAILLRKVSPQGNRPLPKEAFECLGRYYMTQKHQLQVLRLGNRIVLVSVMPDEVSTLAEITDPEETVAFLGLCRRLDTNSATEMFRNTVASMSTNTSGEESRLHKYPVATQRKEHRGQLDIYSDPDESLASMLARGGRR